MTYRIYTGLLRMMRRELWYCRDVIMNGYIYYNFIILLLVDERISTDEERLCAMKKMIYCVYLMNVIGGIICFFSFLFYSILFCIQDNSLFSQRYIYYCSRYIFCIPNYYCPIIRCQDPTRNRKIKGLFSAYSFSFSVGSMWWARIDEIYRQRREGQSRGFIDEDKSQLEVWG